MRRTLIVLSLALSIVYVIAAVSECAECNVCAAYRAPGPHGPSGNDAAKKLGRGLANLFMWPCEIFNQMGKANDGGGPVAALTWGFVSGLGLSAVRLAAGIYEVATFPIPCPPGYKPIMTDPDFYLKDETF